MQGGLEIPCGVIIKMLVSEQNLLAMEEYRQLICGNYMEPIDESFLDATNDILEQLRSQSDDEVEFDESEELDKLD